MIESREHQHAGDEMPTSDGMIEQKFEVKPFQWITVPEGARVTSEVRAVLRFETPPGKTPKRGRHAIEELKPRED